MEERFSLGAGRAFTQRMGMPYFREALHIVKNEAVFAVYLLALVMSLLTFNAGIIGIALLPLLAFVALKRLRTVHC